MTDQDVGNVLKRVNAKDLERLGISLAQWEAHHRVIDAEPMLHVRVVGGQKVLTEALLAAGAEFVITCSPPTKTWPTSVPNPVLNNLLER